MKFIKSQVLEKYTQKKLKDMNYFILLFLRIELHFFILIFLFLNCFVFYSSDIFFSIFTFSRYYHEIALVAIKRELILKHRIADLEITFSWWFRFRLKIDFENFGSF